VSAAPTSPPTRVRFGGHSTVLLDIDGVRVLTDPLLRRRVAHLRRDPGAELEAVAAADVVLISHAHRDHLDLPSLALLPAESLIVVPSGVGALVRRQGHSNVTEVVAGDSISVRGVEVAVLPAVHNGRRDPASRTKGPALGFAILASRRVYFAGDTALFDAMAGLVPKLDLALVPIWGWGPSLGRGGHLDPAAAALAVELLQPRIAIPIHWGTYAPFHHTMRGRPSFLEAPAAAFAASVAARSPGIDVRVLRPGDETTL
jgi:L-ascorbate metabolism protein UlaG (beta-lactamase superfamily)